MDSPVIPPLVLRHDPSGCLTLTEQATGEWYVAFWELHLKNPPVQPVQLGLTPRFKYFGWYRDFTLSQPAWLVRGYRELPWNVLIDALLEQEGKPGWLTEALERVQGVYRA